MNKNEILKAIEKKEREINELKEKLVKNKSEEIEFAKKLFEKLQKFAEINNNQIVEWNNPNQVKFYIIYQHDTQQITIGKCYYYQPINQVFFTERRTALHAIDEFNSELKKYFGVEED